MSWRTSGGVAVAEPSRHDHEALRREQATRKKLLVVEDDKDLIMGLEITLGHAGYQVQSCWEGHAGLAAIEEHEPDLVILDLMLPGMNGYHVLYEMRRRNMTMPVLVLTGNADQQSLRRARRMGAAGVLTKPTASHEILETIRGLL